jgi:hypothetical protein
MVAAGFLQPDPRDILDLQETTHETREIFKIHSRLFASNVKHREKISGGRLAIQDLVKIIFRTDIRESDFRGLCCVVLQQSLALPLFYISFHALTLAPSPPSPPPNPSFC